MSYIPLINELSELDKKRIKNYLYLYGNRGENIPLEEWLKYWEHSNQKLYKALYIPSKESVVKMENGSVYTESSKGATVISKKYGMWKSKPSIIIEHNEVTGIANKKVMNGNGTYSLEIRDMHTPEYRISAGYPR